MEEIKYEYEPHHFIKRKNLSWQQCVKCGLIGLNNPFTRWSVDKGCNSYYHPSYRTNRMKFTALDRR